MDICVQTSTDSTDLTELSVLKSHLNLNLGESTIEDGNLSRFLLVSEMDFEKRSGGYTLRMKEFKQSCTTKTCVTLLRGPLVSIDSIFYYDVDDEVVTITDYDLEDTYTLARITINEEMELSDRDFPIVVEFTAGAHVLDDDDEPVDATPIDCLNAVMEMTGHKWRNRESFTDSAFEQRTVPHGFSTVVDKYHTGIRI